MTDKKFDPTKPCQTRDGLPVEIISTNGRAPWVIVGYVGGSNELCAWRADGFSSCCAYEHLVNIPQKREAWVNLYPDKSACWNYRKDDADYQAMPNRIACVRVEWEE